MAITKYIMIKNKLYDTVRLTIVGSQSSTTNYHYTEAEGNRYYANLVGSTQSNLEAVSFEAYLSFTSSGTQSWNFNLIPMEYGHTAMIETNVVGMNSTGSKGYGARVFGVWRHAGSTLVAVGGSMDTTTKTDFTSASCSFTASATASISMNISGQTSETIDWDVHIKYTKGYHTVVAGSPVVPPPWYPPLPPQFES